MKRFVFVILSIVIVQFGFGQQDSVALKSYQRTIWKFCPLSLIDLTPSVQFGVEYPLKEKYTMQHQLGYISNFWFSDLDANNKTYGGRFKTELRRYIGERKRSQIDRYFALDFMYKYLYKKDERFFWRYSSAFQEQIAYHTDKHVVAVHLKFGFQEPLGKHMVFDYFLGAGIRHIYNISDIPDDAVVFDEWLWWDDYDGGYFMPSFALGFKIGFSKRIYEKQYMPRRYL